ncbi:MAG TPA: hypothetical protein VIH81_13420 [Roseiarcus sp.]
MTGRPIITLPTRPMLTARRLKVTLVLDPDELPAIPTPDGGRASPCASVCLIAN